MPYAGLVLTCHHLPEISYDPQHHHSRAGHERMTLQSFLVHYWGQLDLII
jgi:hypothetical protein